MAQSGYSNDGIARYSKVAMLLHWVIAAAIVTEIALVELTEDLARPERFAYMKLHFALGLTILGFSLFRLFWRLTHRPPPAPATSPHWQNLAAGAVHWIFYLAMIGLPLSGWVRVSTRENANPISFFGLFDIPALPLGANEALHEAAEAAHDFAGSAMIPLIGLHILAALYHQFILRDRLIGRMMPGA